MLRAGCLLVVIACAANSDLSGLSERTFAACARCDVPAAVVSRFMKGITYELQRSGDFANPDF